MISFPKVVNIALAASSDERGSWIGAFAYNDGTMQIVADSSMMPSQYALIARMHELASTNGVSLHVMHPDKPVEILPPYTRT